MSVMGDAIRLIRAQDKDIEVWVKVWLKTGPIIEGRLIDTGNVEKQGNRMLEMEDGSVVVIDPYCVAAAVKPYVDGSGLVKPIHDLAAGVAETAKKTSSLKPGKPSKSELDDVDPDEE